MDLKVYGVHYVMELAPLLLAVHQMTDGKETVHHGNIAHMINAPSSMSPAAAAMRSEAAQKLVDEDTNVEVDVVTNAETQTLRFSVARPDLRILFNVTEGLYRLVARRSSGINSLKDFKGKKVATFPRTSAAFYLLKELQSVGLKESDVTIVPLAPVMEMSRALVDREVDAIAIWEPASQDAVDRLGDDAIEFRTKGIYRELFNLNTTAEKLADPVKRKQIVEFTRKVIACSKQLRENPEPVFPLMAKVSKYDIDLLRRAWPHHNFTPSMPKDMLDVLVEEDVWIATETGHKPRSREELAKLIDDSVWKEANS
jgi:NitT/TauT family transport system substrate-binding protein